MKNIFITGMLRSGTTLLEKSLHSHPGITVASQPFSPMYIYFKNKYYRDTKKSVLFPLSNYFLEGEKRLELFYDYLINLILSEDDLSELRSLLGRENYIIKNFYNDILLDNIGSGKFIDIYFYLQKLIPFVFPKEELIYFGSKEVICEEYMPYILKMSDAKGIIIIRDPRDVIVSMNHGDFKQHVGEIRPTLFNLRNWRKSFAFAAYLENHQQFMMIKYEALVENFADQINKIFDFLEIPKLSENDFVQGLKDQHGLNWPGNSSFETTNDVKPTTGKYVKILPAAVISYIETCCLPEMKYLGYGFHCIDSFDEDNIISFKEPYDIVRPEFSSDYSSDRERIDDEIKRYHYLSEDIDNNEACKWFLFKDVYEKLKSVQ